jgi:hypothetical protein
MLACVRGMGPKGSIIGTFHDFLIFPVTVAGRHTPSQPSFLRLWNLNLRDLFKSTNISFVQRCETFLSLSTSSQNQNTKRLHTWRSSTHHYNQTWNKPSTQYFRGSSHIMPFQPARAPGRNPLHSLTCNNKGLPKNKIFSKWTEQITQHHTSLHFSTQLAHVSRPVASDPLQWCALTINNLVKKLRISKIQKLVSVSSLASISQGSYCTEFRV